MKLLTNKQSDYLLILLVAADLGFIALGIIYECGFIDLIDACRAFNFDDYYSLTRDRGYAELFQYLKEYWLVILFLFLAINQNIKTYLGWSFLFSYILVDDALEIHENLGLAISEKLNFIYAFNLRPRDYGELIFFAVVGAFFFAWLSISYRLSNKKERKITRHLIGILLGLATFGIFADVIHIMFEQYPFWKSTIGIIEDGGEHIVMSLFVCYVMSLTTNSSRFRNKTIY